jgi:hypothetical protein
MNKYKYSTMGNRVIFAYIYIYIPKCQLLLHYNFPPIQGLEYRCQFLDYVCIAEMMVDI